MMKQKAFTLLEFFTLLVMTLSVVSAGVLNLENTSVIPTTATQGDVLTLNFNLTHDGTTTGNYSLDWSASSVEFTTLPTLNLINISEEKALSTVLTIPSTVTGLVTFSLNVTGTDAGTAKTGFPITLTITAAPVLPQGCTNPLANNTNTTPVTSNNSLCTYTTTNPDTYNLCGTDFNDSILRIEVKDESNDVEDEFEWRPLDNIELELDLDNDGDDDYDFAVRLFFFDSTGNDVSDEIALDEDDLEIDGFDVDENDDAKEYITFQIDGDVEAGDYDLYVKVIREDDESCYVKLVKTNVEIKKQTRQVVVKDIESTSSVKAGETVSFEVEIANVGKNDEDKVKIHAYNKDLGINLYKEIEDLDEGDSEKVTFLVTIPSTAKQGAYSVIFSTQYDYDDKDEKYDEVSESEDNKAYTITVFGATTAPTIGAKLTSDAKVGKELSIEVTLTNNGDTDETYDLIVEGASWAKDIKLEDDSVLVKAGETKTVSLSLVPEESGSQSFTIKAVYGDEIKRQAVSVKIDSSTGFLTGAFAGVGTMGYLIAAIILLAILVLIVAVFKLASRPRRQRIESIAY